MAKYFSFKPGLSLKGKKFKGLRGFAGKPFHPPLTDVAIGGYTIAGIMILLGFLFGDSDNDWLNSVADAAPYVLFVSYLASVPTILTGFFDWLRSTPKGTQARRMVNAHAWTMLANNAVALALLFTIGIGGGDYEPDGLAALLAALMLALSTIGGTLGGDIVFSWGFNVEVAKDHPVWHPSDSNDYVSPHQEQPPRVEA
jgi:uncharacterized membrane protein